jgi:hypothetical protein
MLAAMKNYLGLFLVSFFVFLTVKVTGTPIDKAKLERARDYINGRFSYLVVKGSVEKSNNAGDGFASIASALATQDIKTAINYTDLRDLVDNSFPNTVTNVIGPINNIDVKQYVSLSENEAAGKMIDAALAIVVKKYDPSFIPANEKTLLTLAVVQYLQAIPLPDRGRSPEDDNLDENEIKRMIGEEVAAQTAGFVEMKHLLLLFVAFLLLLGGVFVYFFRRLQKIRRGRGRETTTDQQRTSIVDIREENTMPWYKGSVPSPQLGISEMNNVILNSEAVQSLAKDLGELKAIIERNNPSMNRPNSQSKSASQPQLPVTRKEPEEEVFYMAGPVNNYFPLTGKSFTKENTVYRFVVKGNKQEANYELHTSGAPVNEILSMIESYVKPACDEENLPGGTVKNIITRVPGVAVLEGDKWMIKTKALIRYE